MDLVETFNQVMPLTLECQVVLPPELIMDSVPLWEASLLLETLLLKLLVVMDLKVVTMELDQMDLLPLESIVVSQITQALDTMGCRV